jgi:cytochrome c oxidase subunit 2
MSLLAVLPPAASSQAAAFDSTFMLLLVLGAPFAAVVILATIWMVRKFQKTGDSISLTPGFPDNLAIEALWVVAPTGLVFIAFVAGFHGYMRQAIVPANALQIQVTASDSGWNLVYTGKGVPPASEGTTQIVVPAGEPVELLLRTSDTTRSVMIPDFRINKAIVPGRSGSVWFEASEDGNHDLYTASSGPARAQIVAKSGKDWSDYYMSVRPPGESPKKLYEQYCMACHSNQPGLRIVGPSFHGLFGKDEKMTDGSTVVVDDAYILESVRKPQAKIVAADPAYAAPMPPFPETMLDDYQVKLITDYIKSLK